MRPDWELRLPNIVLNFLHFWILKKAQALISLGHVGCLLSSLNNIHKRKPALYTSCMPGTDYWHSFIFLANTRRWLTHQDERNTTDRHMRPYDALVLPQICDTGSRINWVYLWAGASSSLSDFLRSFLPVPAPRLWSGPPSHCEAEWLASRLWSGCAWIKVVTEQRGGWQMPRPESFSIRLPFQAVAKVKHFAGR